MKIRASSNWLTDSEINPQPPKTASAAPKLYNEISGFLPGPHLSARQSCLHILTPFICNQNKADVIKRRLMGQKGTHCTLASNLLYFKL